MKKSTNVILIGALLVLGIIYLLIEFTGGEHRSDSLRSHLVTLDTAKVSKVLIYSASDSVDLQRVNGEWELTLQNGKKTKANQSALKNAIETLKTIKPDRIVTKKQSKWKDYQVDSTGTRIQIFEGSKKSLDLVIGRFGMDGQRAYHTFVRLFNDQAVYAANNFMSFSVPSNTVSYRNQLLAKIAKDSVTQVNFQYPADSSFNLEKVDSIWTIVQRPADSTSVAEYLNALSYISSKEFVDEDVSQWTNPVMSATFNMSNGESVVLDAYQKDAAWVIHSTENREGYFQDSTLVDKIFKGRSAFEVSSQ